mgnify:FL=1
MKILEYLSKILIILFILQIIILPVQSNAASIWDDIFSSGDKFIQKGKDQATSSDQQSGGSVISDKEIKEANSDIFNTLLSVGIVLAVLVGGVLGVKFMIASAEDKAKIKEAMIPYVLGCIVIFGAFGIWKLAITILNNL